MSTPKVLVLAGDGINCENETALCFERSGFKSKIMTANDLAKNQSIITDYQSLVLPGGFSFGDELGSGRILALKLKYYLKDLLDEFKNKDKLVLGICNGFQVLTQLGLLPDYDRGKLASLCFNTDLENRKKPFVNKWVELKMSSSNSIWMQGLKENIWLPVRHGEGRLVFKENRSEEIALALETNGQIPLYYENDFNGSYKKIAALSDPSGRVLGLMPHPEAAYFKEQLPEGHESAYGKRFFDNAKAYFS